MMRSREEGSTLLTVLAAVLILTTLMTALLAISVQDMANSGQYSAATAALANARSGMQAVYQKTLETWKNIGGASTTDLSTAVADLNSLSQSVLNLSVWNGAPFTINQFQLGANDIQQVLANQSSASSLWADYNVKVSSTVNGITRTLTDTFTVSGSIEALNYVLYTPGNLFVLGAPKIEGKISAGGSVYFNSSPWRAVGVVSWPTFLTVGGNYETWYPEPSSYEPNALPTFSSSPTIAATNLYSFIGFNDMGSDYSRATSQLGNAAAVTGAKQITTSGANPLSKYAVGSVILKPSQQNLPANYVQNLVNTWNTKLSQAPKVKNPSTTQLPLGGGYINNSVSTSQTGTQSGQPFEVTGNTYVNGTLTINSNANVEFDQPLFVNGDLYINGTFASKAAIYVQGNVYINNVPVQTSRLEIFCTGNISLSANTNSSQFASQYATFNAFLASNQNIYMGGMSGMYHIIGGLSGQNVVLNATVGTGQRSAPYGIWPNFLQSTNMSDTTPRLWITYDNSYVTNPLAGSPTLNNLIVQPMPQPTVTFGS